MTVKSGYLSRAIDGLGELSKYSFENMRLVHSPPHRSMYAGGAGIAYTFWKAACALDDPLWLDHARLWIEHVYAAPQDGSQITYPEIPDEPVEIQPADSLLFGDRGLLLTRALIAASEDSEPTLDRSLGKFMAPENKRLPVQEYLQGIAGRLVGSALLYRELGQERLKEYGDALARDLIETAGVTDGSLPWRKNPRLGFAHGRGGNFYALLLWSKETGYALPKWYLPALRQYARSGRKHEHGISWPISEKSEEDYMDTWCNGAPGLIHLWTLAYSHFRDTFLLEAAEAAGEYCIHMPETKLGHICCGAAGVAYAFLALNRIDPGGGWLEQARRYAELAGAGSVMKNWRLGLYGGLAGTVCLMLDMENPEEAALPGVEG
ncbi:MAG: hypothetical protein JSU69_05555 [Candidatus Zixiibacteriota bacterium]|nr:MAG: hypothetical protein JSU69_05555 [candidate division Zixibacteria bacterium]